ncbi:ABC transporter substrate-binding protein [Brucepastera parasyntrophica]|uniref:ABC transporter substrate-binding protein n=1 Tax=Brucepastera parasyntrophica TaxID=2880008 RepID=UPI00210EE9DF|nr:ABC transporter substrate-binding protein [Brucepastera parasyntrophica]ULQ59404.1 ABC transporter substrate-binding protein [Brucepastera parasyntrophica]
MKLLKTILLPVFFGIMLFTGCTEKKASASGEKLYTIGISKITAHPALDAVEQGVMDELAERGINAVYDLQNASGDVNTAMQIATKFKSARVDAIVAIATPTAVAAAAATRDIPVIFATVTDPVVAGLVTTVEHGEGNVTGLSDALPIYENISLFQRIAGIKTLGYIYTTSEANSAASFAELQDVCKELGITLIAQSITNSSEVKQAAEVIIKRVDGIYLTTDNTVYSALPALIEVALANKKPIFSIDPTSAENGGCLIAQGFDYYKAGRATADLVIEVLNGTPPSEIPVKFITDPAESDLLIDLDTAKICGITIPPDVLASAGKIIENGVLTVK